MEPYHRHADDADPARTLKQRALRNLGVFAGALVLVLVGGLGAGWLYAKGSPQRAAASVVSQFVVAEPNVGDAPPADGQVAPTSGAHDGEPVCGRVADPISVDDQLATLATGAVIVQYRPADVDEDELLDDVAARDDVLVAPNPALDVPVVATAWTQRMALPGPTAELLFAFVTAHRGIGPQADAACPLAAGSRGSGQ